MYIDHYSNKSNATSNVTEIISNTIFYSAVFCFLLSLFIVSFYTSGDDINGIWVLLLGWIGIVIFQLAWFANPLNLLALMIKDKNPKISFFLSLFALLLASQAFTFTEVPLSFDFYKIYIKEQGLGFYCWYLSQVLLLIYLGIEVTTSLYFE